jgi:predicted S18 family serine protease
MADKWLDKKEYGEKYGLSAYQIGNLIEGKRLLTFQVENQIRIADQIPAAGPIESQDNTESNKRNQELEKLEAEVKLEQLNAEKAEALERKRKAEYNQSQYKSVSDGFAALAQARKQYDDWRSKQENDLKARNGEIAKREKELIDSANNYKQSQNAYDGKIARFGELKDNITDLFSQDGEIDKLDPQCLECYNSIILIIDDFIAGDKAE